MNTRTPTDPGKSGEEQSGKSLDLLAAMQETARRRFPKIIDGALDLMPAGPPWDEAEFVEWLSFFEQACRVYYRIPREKSVSG